mgnify:FL=1
MSTETKWTPGPWSVVHDTDITGVENDPANGCVGPVDVAHVYLRTVPGRTEANATLIAEAPALYKELEALTGVVQSDPFLRYSEDSLYGKAIKAALAVLKKARGE